MIQEKPRCSWCNVNNPRYVLYHDNEWGVIVHDDIKLFELLTLEIFQSGLSWEIVLNKREGFRKVFNDYDIDVISMYDDDMVDFIIDSDLIIKNRGKIKAIINNANIFKMIQEEYGTFDEYIWSFTNNTVIYENDKNISSVSIEISKDLKKRGMKYIGPTVIYSFLQAIGIIYSHEKMCYLYRNEENNNECVRNY